MHINKRFLLAVVLLSGTVARAEPPPPELVEHRTEEFTIASDPATALRLYSQARRQQDWATVYAVLSPGLRDYLLFEAAFAMGSGAASEEAERIIDKYLDEAKLEQLVRGKAAPTTFEAITAYGQSVNDKRGMFIECYKYLNRNNPATPQGQHGKLFGLQVSEDAACGQVRETSKVVHYEMSGGEMTRHTSEQQRDVTLYFVRTDRGWLLATQPEWRAASRTAR